MSRANILNTRTINLELIGNGKGYRVPPYQRDYSWSEEQWEDLWNEFWSFVVGLTTVTIWGPWLSRGLSNL
jgi:hypothetical protein